MEYVTLAKTAFQGGLSLWKQYRAYKLSPLEKELLIVAAQSGQFALLTVGQR